MYVSGHILTSVLLARGTARQFGVRFGAVAVLMIAASLIDADHLFFYYLDDGTASSFVLHPLHRFWYVVLAVLTVAVTVWRKARGYLLPLLFGVGLHYAMDLVANSFHYNLYGLIGIDVVLFVISLCVVKRMRGSILFLILALIVPYTVNGFLLYGLGMAIDATPIYHYTTIVMLSVAAVWANRVLR